jgi:hypothetical protein
MTTHLRSSINLGLPGVLTLAKHSGSHKPIPILLADEIRRLEKDGCAISPRHSFPLGLGGDGAVDSSCNSNLIRFMVCAEVPSMVGRNQLLCELARPDLHTKVE